MQVGMQCANSWQSYGRSNVFNSRKSEITGFSRDTLHPPSINADVSVTKRKERRDNPRRRSKGRRTVV